LLEGVETRDGEFVLPGLSPGRYELDVRRGFEHGELSFTATRGPNELGDLVLSFGERASEIRGHVLTTNRYPGALLMLTDEATGASVSTGLTTGARSATFEFTDVLPGEYRLSIVSLDGSRYEPDSVLVSPPATRIVFAATGLNDPFEPQVRDEDGEVEAVSLARIHGHWIDSTDSLARDAVERWIVLAKDHRPASGETPADGVVHVTLEPGFGMAFFFLEQGGASPFWQSNVACRSIEGVEVRADGQSVGRSDRDGLALVSLTRNPAAIEFALPGWIVLGEERDGLVSTVRMRRER